MQKYGVPQALAVSGITLISVSRRTYPYFMDLCPELRQTVKTHFSYPNVLHHWRRELRDYGAKAFAGNGQRRVEDGQFAELERRVGRQALEIDFLRRCLRHVEEQRKLQALASRTSSTHTSHTSKKR
jgi:transposase-like protein